MPSPFPGMDPFLEHASVWEEFHHVLITECMYDLGERLPPGYVAKIQERVQSISIADPAAKEYVPDVAVARNKPEPGPAAKPGPQSGAGGGATAPALKPVMIPAIDAMEVREGYVEILRLPDYELVTSIEILSPWNKFGEGVGIYREKRRALVQRGVHVVEIDLLLRGTRTELALPLPAGDYYAMVFLGNRLPDVNVYAWRVRDPLPVISAPLKVPDESVLIDLPAVVRSAYDRSHYERKVGYDEDLPRGLSPEGAKWAQELLRAAGRR